ncbi:hypothetical protein [Desulfovibrio piger]|nr:hypothetical protein [Desulfovibrio piger]
MDDTLPLVDSATLPDAEKKTPAEQPSPVRAHERRSDLDGL